ESVAQAGERTPDRGGAGRYARRTAQPPGSRGGARWCPVATPVLAFQVARPAFAQWRISPRAEADGAGSARSVAAWRSRAVQPDPGRGLEFPPGPCRAGAPAGPAAEAGRSR